MNFDDALHSIQRASQATMILSSSQRRFYIEQAIDCIEPLFEDGLTDDPAAFDDLCEARSWLIRVQNKLRQHQREVRL